MATGDLPEDGDARVAGQALPPGRRHFAQKVHQLVAWVTDAPMAGAGRTWMALSAAHAQTGLVPALGVQARSSTEPEAGSGRSSVSTVQPTLASWTRCLL